jgi:hypothetical protein
MSSIIKGDEKEKAEVIDLLRKQMTVEGELIRLYMESADDIKSIPVRHLLRMIQLDSKKHLDICQVAIEVLQGEEMLSEEKEGLIEGLQRHIDLEKESIDRAKRILKNTWMEDEKRHHKALKKLAGKRFFRLNPRDFVAVFRDEKFIEERYKRAREFERKKEKLEGK